MNEKQTIDIRKQATIIKGIYLNSYRAALLEAQKLFNINPSDNTMGVLGRDIEERALKALKNTLEGKEVLDLGGEPLDASEGPMSVIITYQRQAFSVGEKHVASLIKQNERKNQVHAILITFREDEADVDSIHQSIGDMEEILGVVSHAIPSDKWDEVKAILFPKVM